MTIIPTFHFTGQCEEAIRLYIKTFDCKVKSIMHYSDAVARGWEKDIPEISNYVYHSEILFGEQIIRMSDNVKAVQNTNTAVFFAVMLETREQAQKAFDCLKIDGTIVEPFESTPYSAGMGSVVDKYGIRWRLMCI